MENYILNDLPDDMILADGVSGSYDLSSTGRNGNLLIVGSTGAGKTMSIIEPQILHTENDSIVVSLAKSEKVDGYAAYLRSKGYVTEVMDLVHPEKSTCNYDPMQYLFTSQDIIDFANSMVKADATKQGDRDPYWDNAASLLIAAEISGLLEKWKIAKDMGRPCKYPTMNDVLDFHDSLDFYETAGSGFTNSNKDRFFSSLVETNKDSYAYRCWRAVKGLASKTVSCIASTVNTVFAQTFPKEIRQFMTTDSVFRFEVLGELKTALFIVTSPVSKASQLYANLIYSAIFKSLFDQAMLNEGVLDVPVHVLCDDFACGSRIPNFASYLSVMRSSGISATILLQSFSQLKSLYGEADMVTIMDNCDQMVYLGCNDLDTCNQIARRMNVPLDVVLNLPIGEAIVFRRGFPYAKAKRYQTLRDVEYLKMCTLRELMRKD